MSVTELENTSTLKGCQVKKGLLRWTMNGVRVMFISRSPASVTMLLRTVKGCNWVINDEMGDHSELSGWVQFSYKGTNKWERAVDKSTRRRCDSRGQTLGDISPML